MLPLFAAAGAFVERLDLAAGWERLPAVLAAVRKAVSGRALVRCKLSHAYEGGGALELELLGPPGPSLTDLLDDVAPSAAVASDDDPAEDHRTPERTAEEVLAAALTAASEAGATLSHHRGVGLARALLLPRELGDGMRALRALKQAFDPRGILNPGKLLL
jgi:FAD/FMN-containing dehydrogenase